MASLHLSPQLLSTPLPVAKGSVRVPTQPVRSLTHLIPALGVHIQLHQRLQVAHLQVGLSSIARTVQLLKVLSTHEQGLPLSLVQLPGNVNQPGEEGRAPVRV